MNLRQGLVVGTHPEDYSLDLVMLDDGSRVTGAQMLVSNGSARTGTFDMPHVPKRKKKWDVTERTDQDQIAMVGYFGRHPVVVGFLYPQVNQITRSSDKSMTYRHQSDVTFQVAQKGAITISHPGGLTISVGTPGAKELEFDASNDAASINRNTAELPDFRITIKGGNSGKPAFDMYVSKDGEVTITSRKGLKMTFDESIAIESKKGLSLRAADAITINAGKGLAIEAAGVMSVRAGSGLGLSAGSGISQTAPGISFNTAAGTFSGRLSASGDVTGSGVSLSGHKHDGVEKGEEKTAGPTRDGVVDSPVIVPAPTTGTSSELYGSGLPGDTNPDTRPVVVSGPSSDTIIHYGGPGQPGYNPVPGS